MSEPVEKPVSHWTPDDQHRAMSAFLARGAKDSGKHDGAEADEEEREEGDE